ncbi:hypothetical protein NDU88_006162 [Pleurodeles waltl]|uniref:Uncharacterized protein n=1 Tax=Pleurodeles waltl TaxID=8319 RepID=A0AAV7NS98_PLEWA|nr:hypothetical protein NDU88_006162 [Pleurodeles waltl]
MRRQISTLHKQLHALDGDRAEYALLRTKQRYYTRGDRAGRLLAHRLRVQVVERRVAELQLPDGTWTDREDHIIAQFEQFFTDLYAEKGLDGGGGVERYLASVPLPRLPLTDGEALDGDINIVEVLAAIQRLLAGKAPRADGFSAEFYKSSSSVLALVLV